MALVSIRSSGADHVVFVESTEFAVEHLLSAPTPGSGPGRAGGQRPARPGPEV